MVLNPILFIFLLFECIVHFHLLDSKIKKMDYKSFQCVLLGISEESKANRLYNSTSKKIVVSSYVGFEENEC